MPGHEEMVTMYVYTRQYVPVMASALHYKTQIIARSKPNSGLHVLGFKFELRDASKYMRAPQYISNKHRYEYLHKGPNF